MMPTMETLEILGMALGFGVLSGVNLYLTAFVTGLVLRFDLLDLGPQFADLLILENPWVLGVSGVMFVMEAFADKIPWVDSTWDVIHTGIRPIGGVLLAVATLGDFDPMVSVIGGLLCGGTSLLSHSAKAGTRAMINLSPEPVTNIAASTIEDAFVLGGLGVMAFAPGVAFGLFLVIALLAGFIAWKTFGGLKRVYRKIMKREPKTA